MDSGMKGYLLNKECMVDVKLVSNPVVLLNMLGTKVILNYVKIFGNRQQSVYLGKTSVEGKKIYNPSNPTTWKMKYIKNTWSHGSISNEGMIVISTAITSDVVPQQDDNFETWKQRYIRTVGGRKKEDNYTSFLEDELIKLCRTYKLFLIMNSEEYHPGNIADNSDGHVLYMKFKCVRS